MMATSMFGMIGISELLILLAIIAVFLAVVGGVVVLALWLNRRQGKPVAPTPQVPSAPATRRLCPQCGQEMAADAPQGLCPNCLMKVAMGSETGNPGAAPVERQPAPLPEEMAKHFPQFEILTLLGQGGMGAVYKARQPALDRFVALKVLPAHAAADAGFAERFNREARALAKLNHPNIVAVYEFGQADGLHYLIMEFVDGPNLRQVEQAGRLTPEQALEIVPQICEALQFAHNEGVVHRDIKPENILLDKKGRVKITDFGIAKLVGVPAGKVSLTGAKDVLGTPHYMAPEQVEKPATVDHRADIYSLGVVFYELLTGELPLGKFQPPSKKVQVDVRLDEVVLHALEKEPQRRYQQASQVKTDVETIAHTAPPSSTVSPAVLQRRHGLRVKSIVLFVASACFLVASLLFAWSGNGTAAMLSVGAMIGLGFAGYGNLRAASALDAPLSPPVSAQVIAAVRQQVKGPASWLVATGILNWIAIPLIVLVTAAIVSGKGVVVFTLPTLLAMILSSVIILAGLRMKRLEAYPLALIGSILAMLVTPGNLIGLPVGIWSLVVLCRREVREAFDKGYSPLSAEAPPPARGGGAWKVAAVIVAAILLLLAIPIGAILLSIGLPAFLKARERARIVQGEVISEVPITPPLSVSFSPVREVLLNDLDESRGNEALSFASGQLLSFAPDFGQQSAEARAVWLDKNHIDLLVDYARGQWALVSRGLQFRDLHIAAWDAPQIGFGGQWPDTEVLETRETREGTLYLLPTNAQPPLTFTFRTANGDHGVLQITGLFTNEPRGMKLRYKLAQLPGGGGGEGGVASAGQNAQRKFVRLVVGTTAMTFEGQPTSWEGVGALVAKVPDRNSTVLEVAVTSDQITVAQQNEWFQRAIALARQHGFEYASFIGIQPPGSKGTSDLTSKSPDEKDGPVSGSLREAVLHSLTAQRPIRLLDLDRGEEIELPAEREKGTEEQFFHWIAEHGVDLMAQGHRTSWTLTTSLKLASLEETSWPLATPTTLREALTTGTNALRREDIVFGYDQYRLDQSAALPLTFAFETRQGGLGVLQITSFEEGPPAVRLRYKFASNQPEPAQAGKP